MDWPRCLGAFDAGAVVSLAALAVSLAALAFAVLAFWWLNARRGELQVARPNAYAFGGGVVRLPLAFYNDGAVALLVADLRVVVDGSQPLRWVAVLPNMRRSDATGDVSEFATPFPVPGRATHRVVTEFRGWSPEPSSQRLLRVEAKIHPAEEWSVVGGFDLWAPPDNGSWGALVTYRNAAEQDVPVAPVERPGVSG